MVPCRGAARSVAQRLDTDVRVAWARKKIQKLFRARGQSSIFITEMSGDLGFVENSISYTTTLIT